MSDLIYSDKRPMSDDPLAILKFFSSDLLEFKIVKILLLVTFVAQTCFTLFTMYFFAYILTKHEIISYCPMSIGMLYPLMAIAEYFIKGDFAGNLRNEVTLWSIDSAGPEIHSRIRKEARNIQAYTCITVGFLILGTVLYIDQKPSDMYTCFAMRYFREYWPKYSTILTSVYKCTYVVLAYALVVTSFQLMYFTQHYKFQIILFENYITNVGNIILSKNTDKEYQREIKRRLIFCVKRTQEYIEHSTAKIRYLSHLIAAYSVIGGFVGICIIFFVLSNHVKQQDNYIRLGVTAVCTVLISCGMLWSAQEVESQFEHLGILFMEICWYDFDANNKKLYLFFLTNITKKRTIKFTENYSVNYQLGLAVVRAIYSVSSAFLAVKF